MNLSKLAKKSLRLGAVGISALLMILFIMWLLPHSLLMQRDSPVILPAYQLLMQRNEYFGKSVGVIGYLAGDESSRFPRELLLFPIKDFADFDYDERLVLSVRVEYPDSLGSVTLPEDCLNRYVKVYGEFGESRLGFLPAISVEYITKVSKNEKERICQPINL